MNQDLRVTQRSAVTLSAVVMSAAAVQQLADVLPAVSSGAVG